MLKVYNSKQNDTVNRNEKRCLWYREQRINI